MVDLWSSLSLSFGTFMLLLFLFFDRIDNFVFSLWGIMYTKKKRCLFYVYIADDKIDGRTFFFFLLSIGFKMIFPVHVWSAYILRLH